MPSVRDVASNAPSGSVLQAAAAIPVASKVGDVLLIQVAVERIAPPTLGGITGHTVVQSVGLTDLTSTFAWKRLVAADLGVTVTADNAAGRRTALGLIVLADAGDPVWNVSGRISEATGTTTFTGVGGSTTEANMMTVAMHNIVNNFTPFTTTGTSVAPWTEVIDACAPHTAGTAWVYAATQNVAAAGLVPAHVGTSTGDKTVHYSARVTVPHVAAAAPTATVFRGPLVRIGGQWVRTSG